MAAVIQADLAGLQAMAGRFDALGGKVVAASVPGGVGPAGQATAAAMSGVDTAVAAAGAAAGARAQTTAGKITAGAGMHAAQEADSAAALTALTPPPVTTVV